MKIGDTIIIDKRSVVNPKNGRADLMSAKAVKQKIEAIYSHGAVRTNTGDVWFPVRTRTGLVGSR